MNYGTQFRDLIETTDLLVCPGIHDPLTARAADLADFDALYMTGYGTSLSRTGYPDIGVVTMSEMISNAAAIQETASVPVFCDADTGYGDEKNVVRTVREYTKTGVAGIHIEDQQEPKKGPGGDIQVIPAEVAANKIRVAADVRDERDNSFFLIGRSDALEAPSHDIDDTIERVNTFIDAGADAGFVTGYETEEEVQSIGEQIDNPLIYDWNGDHPRVSLVDLEDYGYDVVIFPVLGIQAAMLETYRRTAAIKEQGVAPVADLVDSFDTLPHDFATFSGYDEIQSWQERYGN